MVSSLLVKGISFLTTPIFTRIIDSEQYGIVATYNSWLSIIEVFAILGLTSAGVFNVGLKDHKEDRDKYISTILVLSNITTIVVFGILFLLKIPFGKAFILPNGLMAAMLVNFLFSPAQVFWITRQRYEFKYRYPFLITIFSTVLSQIVSIFCVINIATPNQGALRIWTNVLTMLAVQVPIYISLLKKGKTFVNFNIWRSTLLFALPLLPHYLAQHIMGSADRIMISQYYSSTGAAIYSVVANISLITTILWNSVNVSLIPITYEKMDNGDARKINDIVIPILVIYAMMCLGVTLIAPEVLTILAPQNYYGGIYAIPPVATTAFVSALYNLYANVEFYYKKSAWIATATIISSIVNVGLNMLFIPKYGYVAAAYTTLVSQVVLVTMHYFGYKKCSKDDFYNNKMIILITFVLIALCLLCNILYANAILRYSVLGFICVFALIKQKYIIAKIISIKKK